MKKQDIGMLVVIAIISGGISILLSGLFISSSSERTQKVEVVQPIKSEFQRPPSNYFNADSLNPTQNIQIDENSNEKPFGNS